MKNRRDENQRPGKSGSGKSNKFSGKTGKYAGKKSSPERSHDPDFSPLKKFRNSDNEPEVQKGSVAEGKSIYKGRGKDQKPVYANLEPGEGRSNPKKPFKTDFKKKVFKGKRDEASEKPNYDLKKIDKPVGKAQASDEIRLNKYIANSGICSRREADKLIEKGDVKVNGEVITELGHKVSKKDRVTYQGRVINPEKPVYILLNKPKDFITTTDDPMERKTVMDLIKNACEERVFPVGRLDRNTTGLLLFTNDGELAAKLSHPSNKIKKIYQVTLDKPLSKNDEIMIIEEGLTLEDGPVKVDDMQVLSKDRTILGLEIHVGKNRIVRRIFAHLGYDVVALDRVIYAGLTKKDIKRGSYRFLSEMEVVNLKYFK